MNLEQERAQIRARIAQIKKTLEVEGRELTPDEVREVIRLADRLAEIEAQLNQGGKPQNDKPQGGKPVDTEAKHAKAAQVLELMNEAAHSGAEAKGARVYQDTRPETVRRVSGHVAGKARAQLAAKSGQVSAPDDFSYPVVMPFKDKVIKPEIDRVPLLREVLPHVVCDGPTFRYLRQTKEQNNAAVVAPGAVKPTSEYAFDEVEGRLAVVAHISQPLDTYMLSDNPAVMREVAEGMLYGLFEKQEDMYLNGDSAAESSGTGVLNTSGILTQAAAGDLLTTTRKAITSMEKAGSVPGVFVFHPDDWERIELSRNSSGALEFSEGPVNRAEKRLWGVQVAVSKSIEQGTAALVDLESAYYFDDKAIKVEAAAAGDDFTKNQVRLRVEFRTAIAVTRPHGVVKITLDA
ncbi:phage major capsid protein [Dermabacteraceae bacterium P13138]